MNNLGKLKLKNYFEKNIRSPKVWNIKTAFEIRLKNVTQSNGGTQHKMFPCPELVVH